MTHKCSCDPRHAVFKATILRSALSVSGQLATRWVVDSGSCFDLAGCVSGRVSSPSRMLAPAHGRTCSCRPPMVYACTSCTCVASHPQRHPLARQVSTLSAPGALVIASDELRRRAADYVNAYGTIITFCTIGGRSGMFCKRFVDELIDFGHFPAERSDELRRKIVNILGGIASWVHNQGELADTLGQRTNLLHPWCQVVGGLEWPTSVKHPRQRGGVMETVTNRDRLPILACADPPSVIAHLNPRRDPVFRTD